MTWPWIFWFFWNFYAAPSDSFLKRFCVWSLRNWELVSLGSGWAFVNPLRPHQFPYKFASRGVFAITFLLFATCMTTCTFLERYFNREAYSVIKIRKRNKMLTKITLEVACSKNVLVHLRRSSKLWAQILQNFQMYTCTFFVAMPSQSPSLPFDSVQGCLHGRECVHFGQQVNMWFYTYSSMLCP